MSTCCVCNRERETFKEIVLDDKEAAAVRQLTGAAPLDKYIYCKACWALAGDKVQGPQLMKGLLQLQFKRNGVRNGEDLAERIRQHLVRKASDKPVS
jgi:hypothetical protein